MGRFEREKGKRSEREAAAMICEKWGVHARRGRQYSGSPDSPDVVCDIDGVHVEVKMREREAVRQWAQEAREDAGPLLPIVLHRKSRGGWLLTLYAEDAVRFAELLLDARIEAERRDESA